MKKNFKEWHNKKENLENDDKSRLFFHEREVMINEANYLEIQKAVIRLCNE